MIVEFTVPPEACFANFRWDDCGQAPVPVMYYWKPGSRCEVGLWRGCLPNLNMFQDEYECVATCIFTARAGDEDYHKIYASGEDESISGLATVTSADDNCTDVTTGQTLVPSSDATVVTEASEVTKATELSPTGASEAVTGETVTTG